ncbi:MAG: hypothetical protein EI684_23475 [Candidatus Viridilinea halotolerans]|uniref:Yip1 domain-containing protein n=1 Tax=Candidatus Viridilinea halotolerans TaxID=2491704 RepID=A0A426TQ66_9CHLR|nr:MAG: hypothetical protein EI684_23475 [Candidatus Viridilinea halotolerans]
MVAEQLTNRGIAALRAGDRALARRLLTEALRANPQDTQAWLWLAGALPDDVAAQRYCLQRVLALDPTHRAARQGLTALTQRATRQAVAAAPAPPAPVTPPVRVIAPQPRAPLPPSPPMAVAAVPLGVATPKPLVPPKPPVASQPAAPLAQPKPPVASQPAAPLVPPKPKVATAPPSPLAPQPAAPPLPPAVAFEDSYINPWLALWLQPRRAMRSAIALRSTGETWLLAALAGVSGYLAAMAWGDLGATLGPREVLAVAVIVGPLLGMILLQLVGVLLRTGGWLLGGRAAAGRVRAALAWATTPLIFGLPLWVLQLLIWPEATFQQPTNFVEQVAISGANVVHVGLWLWVAWLSLVGLAEAQRTGVLRALAAWFAALVVVVLALGALFGGAALIIGSRGG